MIDNSEGKKKAGRPAKSDQLKRHYVVRFVNSKDEYMSWLDYALAHNITMSELCRMALGEFIQKRKKGEGTK